MRSITLVSSAVWVEEATLSVFQASAPLAVISRAAFEHVEPTPVTQSPAVFALVHVPVGQQSPAMAVTLARLVAIALVQLCRRSV